MEERLDNLSRPGEVEAETWQDNADIETTGASDTSLGGGVAAAGGTATATGGDDRPLMRDHPELDDTAAETEPLGDPTILGLQDVPGSR